MAATWTNQSKNDTDYDDQSKTSGIFFLLQELGKYLLQENGYRIITQESISWSGGTLNTASYDNQSKN